MNKHVRPDPAAPGQESVWSYPRPPRVEPAAEVIAIDLGGWRIAETQRALRVLETSHPPGYYLPLADVARGVLRAGAGGTWCEFKGQATYFDVVSGEVVAQHAGWHNPQPARGYEALVGHVAFYPARMDACWVDGERVRPQQGSFYGGWITGRITGPFKGRREATAGKRPVPLRCLPVWVRQKEGLERPSTPQTRTARVRWRGSDGVGGGQMEAPRPGTPQTPEERGAIRSCPHVLKLIVHFPGRTRKPSRLACTTSSPPPDSASGRCQPLSAPVGPA